MTMPIMTNPLRYPGGKRFLVDYVADLIQTSGLTGTTIHEPFAGSAAVSLEMLNRDLVDGAVLVEKDPLIYSFWRAVVEQPEELCSRIDDLQITIDTWNELEHFRDVETPLEGNALDLGLAGLFFNRTNYSGIIMANPLGGKSQASEYTIDCRFNKTRVKEQIMAVAKLRDKIIVEWTDGIRYLHDYRRILTEGNHFVYIDPPYYEKGQSLYRHHFTDKKHESLATLLRGCTFPWLLSYDNHQFIQNLYFGQVARHHGFNIDSFIKSRTRGAELLISNLEIPPVEGTARVIQDQEHVN